MMNTSAIFPTELMQSLVSPPLLPHPAAEGEHRSADSRTEHRPNFSHFHGSQRHPRNSLLGTTTRVMCPRGILKPSGARYCPVFLLTLHNLSSSRQSDGLLIVQPRPVNLRGRSATEKGWSLLWFYCFSCPSITVSSARLGRGVPSLCRGVLTAVPTRFILRTEQHGMRDLKPSEITGMRGQRQ